MVTVLAVSISPNWSTMYPAINLSGSSRPKRSTSGLVTKDQNASGELGVYDLKSKMITLTGNVVVSQGKNVLRGEQ